jgi:tRNA threonylcarbamoyladenosine biosynthesis protein TsaB
MRVLALDTTTVAGSIALVDGERVILERAGDPSRTYAERLPADILAATSACGMTLGDVDLFAVASGPGSFTGLRIGIATVQGLAFVDNRSVAAISALEALAQLASLEAAPGTTVASWMDAHRGEVFSALYTVAAAPPFEPDRLIELEGAAVGDPAATLARWTDRFRPRPDLFVGDGAVLFRALIAGRVVDPPPLAGAIGRMAIARARRPPRPEITAAEGVRPLYVRRPDAETARDRRAAR